LRSAYSNTSPLESCGELQDPGDGEPRLEVRLLGSPGSRWLPTTWGLGELLRWIPGTCYEVMEVGSGLLLHISSTTATLQVRKTDSR